MKYQFYDTCSLLAAENLFEDFDGQLIISSLSLNELENIKDSQTKDIDIKFAARKLLNDIYVNYDNIKVIVFEDKFLKEVPRGLTITNDLKIISCAIEARNQLDKKDHPDFYFVTQDLSCLCLARMMFKNNAITYVPTDKYCGYKEIYLNNEEMIEFYSNLNTNKYNLLVNEYLIIYEEETKNPVDAYLWDGNSLKKIGYSNFSSAHFGNVKPLKGDIYQQLLADSLLRNKITMVKGPAGSGKTFISLAYLFSQMEQNKIDKVIVFCNTIATKNSAKLGFYPGTRDEKLLDSQIGNLLTSKLGSRYMVEKLIQDEKLILLPMSDIRGYDTTGMNAGIYISEAQNLDIELMKLALQRIGADSVCIIDGDCETQVDDIHFAGLSNGMKRASKVFRGNSVYGEVTLKQIHRSEIASIAEKM